MIHTASIVSPLCLWGRAALGAAGRGAGAIVSGLSRTRIKASPARLATRWRLKSRKIASGLQNDFRVHPIFHTPRAIYSHPTHEDPAPPAHNDILTTRSA